jgi:hypothetical protein
MPGNPAAPPAKQGYEVNMIKEIAAKFTSRCSACGSTITPGQLITYDPAVKYSSRHKVCPSTIVHSAAPLNSPGRAALQGRGRGDFFFGERTDIQLGWTERSKPEGLDAETIHAKDGRYLTCVGLGAHWVSQDEADDFDLIGNDGAFSAHWSVIRHYRLATDEEAAPVKEREAAAAAAKSAKAALDAFERRVIETGKDLDPKYSNRIETPREGVTVLRQWSTASHPSYHSEYYHAVYAVQLADGRIGYRFSDQYYDWPQDYISVVGEFFADEPQPTKICQ